MALIRTGGSVGKEVKFAVVQLPQDSPLHFTLPEPITEFLSFATANGDTSGYYNVSQNVNNFHRTGENSLYQITINGVNVTSQIPVYNSGTTVNIAYC